MSYYPFWFLGSREIPMDYNPVSDVLRADVKHLVLVHRRASVAIWQGEVHDTATSAVANLAVVPSRRLGALACAGQCSKQAGVAAAENRGGIFTNRL